VLTGLIKLVVVEDIYLSIFMMYHNGMQSTKKKKIFGMKRFRQQVGGCGLLKRRLTESISKRRKESHKVLEPMFDHGITRI
jgi:hypothetical protein